MLRLFKLRFLEKELRMMFQVFLKESVFLWEVNMLKGIKLDIQDPENLSLPWKLKYKTTWSCFSRLGKSQTPTQNQGSRSVLPLPVRIEVMVGGKGRVRLWAFWEGQENSLLETISTAFLCDIYGKAIQEEI